MNSEEFKKLPQDQTDIRQQERSEPEFDYKAFIPYKPAISEKQV